jgi:hypothetical protein
VIRRQLDGDDAMWAFINAPSDRSARRLSTRTLYDATAQIGATRSQGDTFIKIAEAELRRRDAWAQPAGRAIYVSAGAALLSAMLSAAALFSSLSK